MTSPEKVKAALLVMDTSDYPRQRLGTYGHDVSDMVEFLRAGGTLPPVVADRRTKKLSDGWHRTEAHLRAFGPDAEIDVIWKDYGSEAELYEDAVRLNSVHGRKLTAADHSRVKIRGEELGISPERLATLIHRKPDYFLRAVADARRPGGGRVPLKRPYRRFAGATLTPRQIDANRHSGGMPASFLARQLIDLIEADALEITDDLAQTLIKLRDLLAGLELAASEAA